MLTLGEPSLDTMPTTARPAPDVQELLAAYRTLDLGPQASPLAVRTRYRELAQVHHPDKWPNGSAQQVVAAERMCDINAAYDLIDDAPLQYREIPGEPASEPAHETPDIEPFGTRRSDPANRSSGLTRVDRSLRACGRLLYGAALGASFAYWMGIPGPMSGQPYAWLVAIAIGIVFARSSWLSIWLLHWIVSWLPRR
jgi:hypothetical protein